MKEKTKINTSTDDVNVVNSVLSSGPLLIIVQILTRAIPFLLNLFIISRLNAEQTAIINIHYPLILSTILYLSRESIRNICQRIPVLKLQSFDSFKSIDSVTRTNIKDIVTISWMSIPMAIILAGSLYWTTFTYSSVAGLSANEYNYGLLLVCIASVIELLCEPFFLVFKNSLFHKVPVAIDGISLVLRTILTAILVLGPSQLGPIAAAYAQLLYSICSLVLNIAYFCYKFSNLLPRTSALSLLLPSFTSSSSSSSSSNRTQLLSLLGPLWAQSLLQHFLTDGEKVLSWAIAALPDQGVYGVVCNLGSLLPRLVFQPIEYLCRDLFTKSTKQNRANSKVVYGRVLLALMEAMIDIGLILVVFGPPYARTLIYLLYGSTWSFETAAPELLSVYIFYVAIIAQNGVTEAFKKSTSSASQINAFSGWLVIFLGIYLGLAWSLTSWLGSIGLILANCVNMIARTAHSGWYIHQYFREGEEPLSAKQWSFFELIPSPWLISISLVYSICLNWMTRSWLVDISSSRILLLQIGIGGIVGLGYVGVIWWSSKKARSTIINLQKSKKE